MAVPDGALIGRTSDSARRTALEGYHFWWCGHEQVYSCQPSRRPSVAAHAMQARGCLTKPTNAGRRLTLTKSPALRSTSPSVRSRAIPDSVQRPPHLSRLAAEGMFREVAKRLVALLRLWRERVPMAHTFPPRHILGGRGGHDRTVPDSAPFRDGGLNPQFARPYPLPWSMQREGGRRPLLIHRTVHPKPRLPAMEARPVWGEPPTNGS